MEIRLLMDLPIEKKHGAMAGRVFECFRISTGRNRLAYFKGDMGETCGAYLNYECEILDEKLANPALKPTSNDAA